MGILAKAALARVRQDGTNFNVAIGIRALNAYNKDAQYPTKYAVAIGFEALMQNEPDSSQDAGLYNTAVGYRALRANVIGDHNTAVGWNALAANLADANTAFGEDALMENTIGAGNTAVGTHALYKATTANSNVGVGNLALGENTTGFYNTAVGDETGIATFTGVGNCTTDQKMTFIGALASVDKSVNAGPFINSTAIGFNAKVDNSNMIKLGNTSVTSVQTNGDYEALDIGDGFICKSPNGTRYRITVSDEGGVVVTSLAA